MIPTKLPSDFTFPTEVFALATNSVMSDFNPIPIAHPRFYTSNDPDLALTLASYAEKSYVYYQNVLNNHTKARLVDLLKYRINYNGFPAILTGICL